MNFKWLETLHESYYTIMNKFLRIVTCMLKLRLMNLIRWLCLKYSWQTIRARLISLWTYVLRLRAKSNTLILKNVLVLYRHYCIIVLTNEKFVLLPLEHIEIKCSEENYCHSVYEIVASLSSPSSGKKK